MLVGKGIWPLKNPAVTVTKGLHIGVRRNHIGPQSCMFNYKCINW